MPQFYTLLTDTGQAKIANAVALGGTIEITELAVGDGGGSLPTPDSGATALINEVRRAAINASQTDPDNPSWIVVEQVLPPDVGGWTIREIGIYDVDGDLIGIGNYPETYKPVLAEGSSRTQTVRFVLEVSDTAAVTLKVDPSVVLATREYVDQERAEHEASRNHPAATTTAQGMVELATQAETNTGIDSSRPVTPATLAGRTATETRAGLVEKATTAEAKAGAADKFADAAAMRAAIDDGLSCQNVAVFDTAGTTEWAVPQVLQDGRRKAHVHVVGGGGGGGASTTNSRRAGGGGGGLSVGNIDLTGVTSVSVTVGAGGAGGAAATLSNGSNGGSSSFGAFLSATGGEGASTGYEVGVSGGISGVGSGGDVDSGLGDGSDAPIANGGVAVGGSGDGGGPGGRGGVSQGGDALGYGGGGGGGSEGGRGGNGKSGIVIVRW